MAIPVKTLLSKKTIVSTSIGTLLTMSGGIYMASEKVNAATTQIAMNTVSIQSLELRMIQSDIADLKQERRDLKRELREDPENPYVLQDLEEVEDELHALELVRECLIDPEREVCD
jgi:hypothetical protein